jgi:hypothetical protein
VLSKRQEPYSLLVQLLCGATALLPRHLAYLSCACIVLVSKRLMLDPTILAALLIVCYLFTSCEGHPTAVQEQESGREPDSRSGGKREELPQ